MSDTPSQLSTSALAKKLNKTTKQMFTELAALGWIERSEESWLLTAKGQFEGGKYKESKRFGRYIIWPKAVAQHKALSSPDSHLLSFSQLAGHLSLERKLTERLFQELGWIKPWRKGWQLTTFGENSGGVQRENSKTGIPFILWDQAILDNSTISQWLDDVYYQKNSDHITCLNGCQIENKALWQISNWFYLTGFQHALKRRLPFAELLFIDLYIPQHQLYIEYWGEHNPANELATKIRKKELLLQQNCTYIEILDEDLRNLDEVLPRKLLKFNIEV